MNRYTIAGAVADAMLGNRVVVVGHLLDVHAFEEHAVDVLKVHRANGAQRIVFASGGVLHVHEANRGAGSLRAAYAEVDVVVLDARCSRDHEFVDAARSVAGEVLRA